MIASIGCADAPPRPPSAAPSTHNWEYEVTAGGRVRYLVNEPRRTVHLVYASTRHPKDTDT